MVGLTDVDSGTVKVDAKDLSAFKDTALTRFRRDRIGPVFQAFNLIPELTAKDNIRIPVMDRPNSRSLATDLLKRLDLIERRSHKPDAMSGGRRNVSERKEGRSLCRQATPAHDPVFPSTRIHPPGHH